MNVIEWVVSFCLLIVIPEGDYVNDEIVHPSAFPVKKFTSCNKFGVYLCTCEKEA